MTEDHYFHCVFFTDEYLELLAKESARLRAQADGNGVVDPSVGEASYEDIEDDDDDDDDDTVFVSREYKRRILHDLSIKC